MSSEKTMLASVLTEPSTIELNEVPKPVAGRRQVLVKVTAVGVCGSDTHFYNTGAIGDLVVRGPIILGHETAGEIVAVGEGVDEERVGQRVAVEPQTPCRMCRACKEGSYHLCPHVKFYGAWPVDGSFAEYALVDDDFAHPIPDDMTDEEGALVEPVSVAIHAVRKAGIRPGEKVLITGAGPIGILTAQVSRAFGASLVVTTDPLQTRRDFAQAHGADQALHPDDLGQEFGEETFDAYIDASGNASAIVGALPFVRRGGHAVLVGMGVDTLELSIPTIQHREIWLTGTFRYVNTWPLAIDMIANKAVNPLPLVTGRFGLADVEDALLAGSKDDGSIKVMVMPQQVS